EPAFFSERAYEQRVPIIAATRARASLLVNRKAFREPARNAVFSHLQSDDVRVLVPECAAPIELARFTRQRGILCDYKSKTDSERAESRHTERAYREVFVVLKNLDDDRTFGREVILRRQLRGGFFEQVRGIRGEHVALLSGGFDNKRTALRLFEVAHGVEQVERVLGPNVERVAFESLLDCFASGFHLAQAQQRHAETKMCVPQTRRDLDRTACE